VREERISGERKHYLSNLPPEATLKQLARWIYEEAHQQMKEELDLDHFEGRSWTGLNRHALVMAYAFLQFRHLAAAGREKKNRLSAAATVDAGGPIGHPRPSQPDASVALP
jgi:SRSO17 transposase